MPEGETPHSLTIICYDNNVDGIRPGDRVEVVGIYRAQSVKVQRIKTIQFPQYMCPPPPPPPGATPMT